MATYKGPANISKVKRYQFVIPVLFIQLIHGSQLIDEYITQSINQDFSPLNTSYKATHPRFEEREVAGFEIALENHVMQHFAYSCLYMKSPVLYHYPAICFDAVLHCVLSAL